MKQISAFIFIILIFLTIGCSIGCVSKKDKEYVIFKTPVIAISENPSLTNWGANLEKQATIIYKSKMYFIPIYYWHMNRCNDMPNCTERESESGFNVSTGNILYVEGVYSRRENYLQVINVSKGEIKGNKVYTYMNVTIINITRLYANNSFESGNYKKLSDPSLVDCPMGDETPLYSGSPTGCFQYNSQEVYNFSFEVYGTTYFILLKKYELCNPIQLKNNLEATPLKFDDAPIVFNISDTKTHEIFMQEIYRRLIVGFEPKINESLIVEGLYDKNNSYFNIYFLTRGNESYKEGGYDLFSRATSNKLKNSYNLQCSNFNYYEVINKITEPYVVLS